MGYSIIGIDCATEPKKRGVATAYLTNCACEVNLISTGLDNARIADLVSEAEQRYGNVLLALDAPLGWPSALGESLAKHSAGQAINHPANALFRRETDFFIKKNFGKQPLDVGADRIARTALSALILVSEISKRLGRDVPLAWQRDFSGVSAIEVYPAATLVAYGMPSGGYKKSAERPERQIIIDRLKGSLTISNAEPLLQSADALDAALCVLSGKDFLEGNSYQPENQKSAQKEGWIWVRRSSEIG